jgi:HSP20 family protein
MSAVLSHGLSPRKPGSVSRFSGLLPVHPDGCTPFFGRGDDPFGSLFREVQKTFEDFSQRTPFARFSADTLSPKIDIAESKDAIDVTAELPGVDEKDLDVTLANRVLTIRGEKKTERDEQDKDKNWHVVERSYGAFSRAIPLPFDADPAKVEAKFDKGVLHIHLPKPAETAQKQQKIEIKKAKKQSCCALTACGAVCQMPLTGRN